VRSFVVANAVHSLCNEGSQVSEKLWNHSLGVALAARMLCEYAGVRDRDQAFLAGLLHDVGEMILLHGDPTGFAKLGHDVEQVHGQMIDKEQEIYGFDHTVIGLTLLDAWNIDSHISRAVLNHHSDLGGDRNNALAELVSIADFLCFKAGLGFFSDLPTPPEEVLTRYRCGTQESIDATAQAIRQAYEEESALFTPA
jgi:putative nucleotidyltransferase with HDIG domain